MSNPYKTNKPVNPFRSEAKWVISCVIVTGLIMLAAGIAGEERLDKDHIRYCAEYPEDMRCK
jgi:hypothetical protein